jgi:ABC-type amino acid transport substrate-binding protein
MHYQGYSDYAVIDRFLLSPATFYRHKSQWQSRELKVGVHDFLKLPRSAYEKASGNLNPAFYDIEFARSLALEMNVKVKLLFRRFDQLMDGLQNGEYDLALGLLADTEFRRSVAAFTDQYVEKSGYDGCLLFRSSVGIESERDLFGKRIAVLAGGANEDYLRKKGERGIVIRAYDRYETCYKALAYNWADAIFGPEPLLLDLARKGFPFETGFQRLGFSTKTCIAVSRENEPLVEQLNQSIERLRGAGTIQRLSEKYLRT